MSPIVVAAFPDRASARAAAESLAQSGIAGIEVRLHQHAVPVTNAFEVEVDELATGGFVGNFAELLDELFEVRPPDTKVVTYDEKVRKEGTLVSVRVASAEDAERVSAALKERGATRISRLPQPGLED
jgi:hypothetical protein